MTNPYGHKQKRKRPGGVFQTPSTTKWSGGVDINDIILADGSKIVAEKEKVNHPSHYGGENNPYETIKVLEAKLTYDEFLGFCKGNAIKYLDRAKGKGNEIQDYAKAVWYLNRMNNFIERIHNEISNP